MYGVPLCLPRPEFEHDSGHSGRARSYHPFACFDHIRRFVHVIDGSCILWLYNNWKEREEKSSNCNNRVWSGKTGNPAFTYWSSVILAPWFRHNRYSRTHESKCWEWWRCCPLSPSFNPLGRGSLGIDDGEGSLKFDCVFLVIFCREIIDQWSMRSSISKMILVFFQW